MSAQLLIAAAIGLIASIEDLRSRTISNWIPLTALACGFGWHLWTQGLGGLVTAFLGAAGGFGVFLIFYVLGGMGGGDVKLMAGFGSIIGAGRLVEASIYTAVIGALLACAVLGISALWRLAKKQPGGRPKAIPYAPAIAAGVLLSLVPR